ncbi:putative membrane protein [Streptomyces phaeochromogenes]|jgi:uncharacterized membrane protein|uniref:DUF2254 domain-containing protein n=1 Tax=Streptomyces phaeochromogenes TaxID=1923 RepID=UPI0027931780|nr:DUF2254 domain-containing protein [Streptomyces phaeochromogenes]MDQ0948331.1 putative membrane protein [Streptomyces phaeochromogenes]
MGDWKTTDGLPRRRRHRALSPLREHLRDTFWFAPTAALVLVFVVWAAATAADDAILTALRDAGDEDAVSDLLGIAEDAKTVVTTISAAMMTFIGVVFSISLVAVQMAAGQFSPRVVRIFVRSRITKATFAVFLATFVQSLLVLTSYDSQRDPALVASIPLVQSVLTLILVGLSVVLFVMYVNSTLRLMRVAHVVDLITREALRVVASMPLGTSAKEPVGTSTGPGPGLGPETARFAHHGRAGVLRDVDIARLVRMARQNGVVLRLVPRIGDFVVPGNPVFAVHGGPATKGLRALSFQVSVGAERTFHQDLGFGLRQLSDIALRALSPAVNDPTTAVQAVDRIVQFLSSVAQRPLGALLHRDRRGIVRLVQPVPGWTDLVDLAFTEIRGCAVSSPQVTRRLLAGLDDLLGAVSEDRRAPLVRHRTLLTQAVERTVPEAADRAFALHPDRQGIG